MRIQWKGTTAPDLGGLGRAVVGVTVIQIAPQMRILVAVEAVDGRKGIDSLARLCQEKLQEGPLLGVPVCVPQPTRNLDSHPHLRRPGVLAGAEAALEGAVRVVAERGKSRLDDCRPIKRSCCWRRVLGGRRRRCGGGWVGKEKSRWALAFQIGLCHTTVCPPPGDTGAEPLPPREIVFIRRLIAESRRASRRALSAKLCEAWGWKQANGAPRDMVCRGLLLMLHRAGQIELPRVRFTPHNPLVRRRRPAPMLIDTSLLSGPLSRLRPLEFQPVRRSGEEPLFNSLIEQHHYLGYEQPVGEHLKYLAWTQGRRSPAWPGVQRPATWAAAIAISVGVLKLDAAISAFWPTTRVI